jgi:hypothetical protein
LCLAPLNDGSGAVGVVLCSGGGDDDGGGGGGGGAIDADGGREKGASSAPQPSSPPPTTTWVLREDPSSGTWQAASVGSPGQCLAAGGRSVEAQAAFVIGRLAPLLAPTSGVTGLIVDLGWLVDVVADFSGNTSQLYPIAAVMSPQWAGATYADMASVLSSLRAAAADAGLGSVRIGTLFVGWASIYQIPQSSFSLRHPEAYVVAIDCTTYWSTFN